MRVEVISEMSTNKWKMEYKCSEGMRLARLWESYQKSKINRKSERGHNPLSCNLACKITIIVVEEDAHVRFISHDNFE